MRMLSTRATYVLASLLANVTMKIQSSGRHFNSRSKSPVRISSVGLSPWRSWLKRYSRKIRDGEHDCGRSLCPKLADG